MHIYVCVCAQTWKEISKKDIKEYYKLILYLYLN